MKLKIFCRCSLFPFWSGYGLISTPVYLSIRDVLFVSPLKVKVKFTLEQATKAQRGRRGTALLFL